MILIMIFIFYSINISFDQLVTELLLMVLISLLLIVSFLYKTSLTTKKEINRK
jgi:cytochrome c oxidase assembly factor CtaG